jgi:hypothetical protein
MSMTKGKPESAREPHDLIFLGGTVGFNRWREERVIPGLVARGVDPACLFNPVVDEWDEQARAREDRAKAQARYQVYVLASPVPESPTPTDRLPAYSMVEATMALYEGRAVIVLDDAHLDERARTVLWKCFADWQARFPSAPLFTDYEEMMDWLTARLRTPRQAGQDTEPMRAVSIPRQCGVRGCANPASPGRYCGVCGLALCVEHMTRTDHAKEARSWTNT